MARKAIPYDAEIASLLLRLEPIVGKTIERLAQEAGKTEQATHHLLQAASLLGLSTSRLCRVGTTRQEAYFHTLTTAGMRARATILRRARAAEKRLEAIRG